jgi:cell division protein FtsN
LKWYGAGVLSGVFLSFIAYLATLPAQQAGGNPDSAPTVGSRAETQPPKPEFSFYTLLPEATIDIEVDPAEVAPARGTSSSEQYILQAGSFRQRDDADRRRAELLLLGLDPKVEESSGDNGRWYRVYLGPFSTRSKVAKARSLTASQDIDTLLLKRSSP